MLGQVDRGAVDGASSLLSPLLVLRLQPRPERRGAPATVSLCSHSAHPCRGRWSCPLSFSCLHAEVGAGFPGDGPLDSLGFVLKDVGGSGAGHSPALLPREGGLCVITFLHYFLLFPMGLPQNFQTLVLKGRGAPLLHPLCQKVCCGLVSGRGADGIPGLPWEVAGVNKSCPCGPAVLLWRLSPGGPRVPPLRPTPQSRVGDVPRLRGECQSKVSGWDPRGRPLLPKHSLVSFPHGSARDFSVSPPQCQ